MVGNGSGDDIPENSPVATLEGKERPKRHAAKKRSTQKKEQQSLAYLGREQLVRSTQELVKSPHQKQQKRKLDFAGFVGSAPMSRERLQLLQPRL